MTWQEYCLARQVLAEEFVGSRIREAVEEEKRIARANRAKG